MPYVISTYRELRETPLFGGEPTVERIEESRRAVATLDEAIAAVRGIAAKVRHHDGPSFRAINAAMSAAEHLTEAVGTVGPLPDGTMIKVELVHDGVFGLREFALPVLGDVVDELGIGELCDAYNAAQEAAVS